MITVAIKCHLFSILPETLFCSLAVEVKFKQH